MHTKINVNLKKIKNNILYLYTVNYKAYSRVKRKRAYFISLFDMYFFLFYIFYIVVDGLQFWSFSLCFPDSSFRYRQVPSQPVSVWYSPPHANSTTLDWGLPTSNSPFPPFCVLHDTNTSHSTCWFLISLLFLTLPVLGSFIFPSLD